MMYVVFVPGWCGKVAGSVVLQLVHADDLPGEFVASGHERIGRENK
jgi:hypothetical protein